MYIHMSFIRLAYIYSLYLVCLESPSSCAEIAQLVKCFPCKPTGLAFIPRTHVGKSKVLWPMPIIPALRQIPGARWLASQPCFASFRLGDVDNVL